MFFLVCCAGLAFLFIVVGVLTLIGYPGAQIAFWTRSPVESTAGQIAWVVISTIGFIVLLTLAVKEYRKKKDRSSTE